MELATVHGDFRSAPVEYNIGTLEAGTIIRMTRNGPPYRVVSVSPSRAYCIPVNGKAAGPDVEAGGGVNISPCAYVEVIRGDLNEAEKQRRARMERERAEKEAPLSGATGNDAHSTEASMSASAMPVRKSTTQANKERRAGLASRKAAIPRKLSGAAARSAKSGRAKTPKTVRKCFCGCGEETMGYFAPGHDGRFHGLMKKLERGEIEPKDIRKSQADVIGPFKKSGEGWRPTKNYKGEPYKPH